MKTTRTSRTNQILAATTKQSHRAVTSGVKEAVAVMQQLVPVDTGHLASSITDEDDGAGHGKIEVGAE